METSYLLTDKKVTSLKGIGEKSEKLFEKVGVVNLNQLLHFYPRAYDHYAGICSLDELKSGEKAAVCVTVTRPPTVRTGSKTTVTILTVKQDFQVLEVIWYHVPYLRKILKKGAVFVFRGNVVRRTGKWHMEHPEIFTLSAYENIEGSVQPVYSLTAGLSNKTVQKAVRQIFDKYEILDHLPPSMVEEYGLAGREDALKNIHFPAGEEMLRAARKRIVFDEFLLFLLGIARLRQQSAGRKNTFRLNSRSTAEQIVRSLPYSLTDAQNRVLKELLDDLTGKSLMNRLIQGDVGSGKTILCFAAMLSLAAEGHQSAMMAPTEVLAVQHYHSLCALLNSTGLALEPPVLLTGSLKAKERREAYERISSGKAKLIIGTHALIQEKVDYDDLGLVVTDEQHRFGVNQRTTFSDKGRMPHILVLSATPIPRTLALILYGDLQISVLDEMPADRLRIKNAVVDTSYREKAYRFISKEIRDGHQAYIVCPMIEKNEDLACENVVDYTKEIRKIFGPEVRAEMLHGRMNNAEKNAVMTDFAEGKIQILVSTTVIEVGVDVPNATVMMVENADRFGLAQLHQLRGRVGRGDAQSYCIFVKSEGREEGCERLEILGNSNDGFYIAEEDLKLRGQGDLFGLRQSGEAGFDLADIFEDRDILQLARSAADRISREDPDMNSPELSGLGKLLDERMNEIKIGL